MPYLRSVSIKLKFPTRLGASGVPESQAIPPIEQSPSWNIWCSRSRCGTVTGTALKFPERAVRSRFTLSSDHRHNVIRRVHPWCERIEWMDPNGPVQQIGNVCFYAWNLPWIWLWALNTEEMTDLWRQARACVHYQSWQSFLQLHQLLSLSFHPVDTIRLSTSRVDVLITPLLLRTILSLLSPTYATVQRQLRL